MRGHQEADLGEPRVYGGYGSGANAVQQVDSGEPAPQASHGSRRVYVADLDETFASIQEAAQAIGCSHAGLSAALAKGNRVVKGHKVRYA